MTRKRIFIYGLVLAVLAVLVYLQFRTWKDFDWTTFWNLARTLGLAHIVAGIALTYFTYVLRALRWKIFLKPVRRQASFVGMVPPTIIGFSGLALLGRPGELIRPYLIARRERLTFSSQIAVWAVERIFDIGAFALLLTIAIFWPHTAVHSVQKYGGVRVFGLFIVALAAGLALMTALVERIGEGLAVWVERRFAHLPANLGKKIAERLREFHRGFDTIAGPRELAQIATVSLATWLGVALAYLEVIRAYGASLQHLTLSEVFPLMGSSMVGSLIQLPGVGGGSQLATISALQRVFGAPPELAASCGILLWLVTFVSVVPTGLVLAHFERLSLRELSHETEDAEQAEKAGAAPPVSG
jgi:glycosyltransferase 2 family protein